MRSKQQITDYAKNNIFYRQAGSTKAYCMVPSWIAAVHGFGFGCIWAFSKTKYFEGFYVETGLTKNAEEKVLKQKEDRKFIDNIFAECNKYMAKLELFYDKYSDFDINKASFEEIKNALEKLDKLCHGFWFHAAVCDEFDPEGDKILARELGRAGLKFEPNELEILLKPEKQHYAQKERLELLKEALDIKEGICCIDDDEMKQFLQNHAKKYYYVDNSWESTKVLTANAFSKKISELIIDNSVEQIKDQIKDITTDWSKEHKKIIKKYNIKIDVVNVIYLFRQLSFFRDERKKYVLLNNHFYDMFFMRLSKLAKIDFADMRLLMTLDIGDKLDAEKYRDLIKMRKHLLIMYVDNSETTFFMGEDAQEIYSNLHGSFEQWKEDIRGTSVSKGKVTGYAVVVSGEAHFGKFGKGQILVAPMTRPEYMPLVKKAAAIITDEGGITCHAAIVSRELGIPCIVGTGFATKVIKDGDLVEVDANKGIIKKLK